MSAATVSAVPSAVVTAASAADVNSSSSSTSIFISPTIVADAVIHPVNPAICRYFLRGICRFGAMCRFSHDLSAGDVISSSGNCGAEASTSMAAATAVATVATEQQVKPSTSRHNWANANAPVFVPIYQRTHHETGAALVCDFETLPETTNLTGEADVASSTNNKTWADVAGSGAAHVGIVSVAEPGSMNLVCPFEAPSHYGEYCAYALHLELCKMCDQYCLHPSDQAQRRKHNQECLQQHEQAMELSFAIARSKDKTCGICFDTIMEKSGREKRFGILPNCSHIFCLECIRKWRQAKQFEHKITRSCPECRVSSDFVCPSAFWVETKEEKDKLLKDYLSALGVKDCKYFKKGDGKCPFGNKCFYKHALPSGEVVDVGCPKRGRKIHRSTNEIIDLLDIYLWEFVDHRDYHWLDLLSSTDDSDDSDWSEE